MGAVATKEILVRILYTFHLLYTKKAQDTCTEFIKWLWVSWQTELHGRTQMNFLLHFPQVLLDSGKILRKALVFESFTCCLRFVPSKLSHYLFTFSVSVMSYKQLPALPRYQVFLSWHKNKVTTFRTHTSLLLSNPCTGLDRPWGFQKAEAPRFQDNRHMKVVRKSALRTCQLYPRKYSWYSFLLEAESTPEP
jgi:hypothetical protein